MSHKQLAGKSIAFLATNGFEQVELTKPWEEITNAGASVELISITTGTILGMNHFDKGDKFTVDKAIDSICAEDYAGLILPGGLANPDALRRNQSCISFIRGFFQQGKPVAAICHAPWILIEADVVRGRKITSWPSLKTDLENAGAIWVDEECVCDQGLITSRNPDDLPAFCEKAIEEFVEGIHFNQSQ